MRAAFERHGLLLSPGVQVAIKALQPVQAVVTVDGKTRTYSLAATAGIALTGTSRIEIEITPGGQATITVNGHVLGEPGRASRPFVATYTPQDYRRTPSSPSPSAQASHSP